MNANPTEATCANDEFDSDEITAPASSASVDAIRAVASQVRDDSADSLTEGKTPPVSTTTYWDRTDMATVAADAAHGRRPLPVWFIVASALALVVAVALVLIILFMTTGNTA